MSLVEYAERELRQAGLFDNDSEYDGALGPAILEVVKKFSEYGHSGASAGMSIYILERLLNFKPLGPLTDDPSEWMDVSKYFNGTTLWQSRRNPEAFSYDRGKTYYLLSEERRWIPFRIRRFIKTKNKISPVYPVRKSVEAALG